MRFIPTYMGNAQDGPDYDGRRPVHPHVHGERWIDTNTPLYDDGSSPRTWGTPYRVREENPKRRFIPTYMGNADPFA